MRVVVTGASGFIGSNVIKELLNINLFDEILCLDIVKDEQRIPVDSKINFIQLSIDDISNLKVIVGEKKYDIFYHFAWIGSSGPLRANVEVQTKNALLTVECLKEAKKIGCNKFVMAGSIMEFESNSVVFSQGTVPSLNTIYGSAKAYAHYLCKPIANQLKIDLIWAYITNAYGVGENSPRFINQTLRKIINNEKLEFTSGTQNYDFVYITDVARAFCLLGLKGVANNNYIIGSGNAKPLKEFIIEMTNANSPNNPPLFGNIPFFGINLPLEVYSIEQLRLDTGFEPLVSFAEGTKKTIDWLKEDDCYGKNVF